MGVPSTSKEPSSASFPTSDPHKCKHLVSWNGISCHQQWLESSRPTGWLNCIYINSTLTLLPNDTTVFAQLLTRQSLSSGKHHHLGSILKALFFSHPNILNVSKDGFIFIWILMRCDSHKLIGKKKEKEKSLLSLESPQLSLFLV